MNPVLILISELKNDDIQLRLNSIRNLCTISKALGPERTQKELLPFLKESLDDEDEVLLALAEELGKFVEYVGGKESAHTLLGPLETLARAEEAVVREKAVESLCAVIDQIPDDLFEKHVVGLLRRLVGSELFTAKTAGCGIFPLVYSKASSSLQGELRGTFKGLCEEETPMVRKAACTNLKKLVTLLEAELVKKESVELVKNFAKDEQDSVRLLAVECAVSIAEKLNEEENNQITKGIIQSLASDKSWRVRYMVANCMRDLSDTLGVDITQSDLLPIFLRLIKDSETEVRVAAASKVTGISKNLTVEVIEKSILPAIKATMSDESQHVRIALASDILGLATVVGGAITNKVLMEYILGLLKDEIPEVRLNVISRLDQVTPVLGLEQLAQNLLPAIVELAEDRQWRVRLSIIEYVPLLAQQLGVDFFNEKLADLSMTFLGDCVYSIREAATKNIKKLTETFGEPWFKSYILPKISDLSKHSNYLYRITTLYCISTVSTILPTTTTISHLLPIVVELGTDKIPNIRLNVAKCLQILSGVVEGAIVDAKIKPLLNTLLEDPDRDVRYFANIALQSFNQI
uniref:TOG domain-containing protein n=1 Tax=Arcella intermedia TaxID=1963864 RepID=A0A6B2L0U3_9EUKA